jgi:hypothetical protein
MPLYNLATIQQLVAGGAFSLANRRAETKVLALCWDTATIQAFIKALRAVHFHKSFLKQSAYDGRKELDVDGYKMHFDEQAFCEGNSSHCCFWTKLALETLPSGGKVAVVTLHLDGSP